MNDRCAQHLIPDDFPRQRKTIRDELDKARRAGVDVGDSWAFERVALLCLQRGLDSSRHMR